MAKPTRWIGSSAGFKKLSPTELRARGISAKAERYVNPEGELISKRQYQQAQLYERTGERISLIERARRYLKGVWEYLTEGRKRAAKAKREKSRKAKGIPKYKKKITDQKIIGKLLEKNVSHKYIMEIAKEYGMDAVEEIWQKYR